MTFRACLRMDTENAGTIFTNRLPTPTPPPTHRKGKKSEIQAVQNPRSSTSGVPPTQMVLQGVPVLPNIKASACQADSKQCTRTRNPRAHLRHRRGPSAGKGVTVPQVPSLQLIPRVVPTTPGLWQQGETGTDVTAGQPRQTSELSCDAYSWCSGYNPPTDVYTECGCTPHPSNLRGLWEPHPASWSPVPSPNPLRVSTDPCPAMQGRVGTLSQLS